MKIPYPRFLSGKVANCSMKSKAGITLVRGGMVWARCNPSFSTLGGQAA